MTASLPARPVHLAMLDGQVLEVGAPALPVDLLGLLRGEGIFETFLVIDGRPSPELSRHAERLRYSAARLDLELGARGLEEELPDFLPLLGPGRWRVRYTVLRGRRDDELLRLWTAGPCPDPPAEVVIQISELRLDPSSPLAGAKTTSRAGFQLARRRAVSAGAWEALLPTVEGDLAECTSANFFVACDGCLYTPPLSRGILAGTTRARLLEALPGLGIPVEERALFRQDLIGAREIYLSNAVVGLVPVREVLGLPTRLPGARGSLLRRLRRAFPRFDRSVS